MAAGTALEGADDGREVRSAKERTSTNTRNMSSTILRLMRMSGNWRSETATDTVLAMYR